MKFTIPNFLSLLRMGLIPLFIIAVIDGESRRALLIFAIAGLTDAMDGAIARFWNQQSPLGAYLDPIADKLLLTSAYVMLSFPHLNHGAEIPIWVTVLVIARDVLLVVVGLILYLAAGVRRFPVTVLSKITTVLQVTAVALVLVSAILPRLELVAEWCLIAVGGLTLASGLDYVRRVNRLPQAPPERT
ncbi:MAG TPA: CDP-alcohol phosphatidyltransferase family protein [Thermoanaerobaculia bacterium]|nr:CDP-alcohol phosphatidyltransferase family protein [Thermoanaerobaculia bacterium]